MSAGSLRADTRLDLGPIDDLTPLEAVFHLDRGLDEPGPGNRPPGKRAQQGVLGSVALGYGRDGDRDVPVAGAALAAGVRAGRWLAIGASELAAADSELVRGRHRALVEYRTFKRHVSDGVLGRYTAEAALDHGRALMLAPIRLGPGRHADATARALAQVHIVGDHDATIDLFAGGELGETRWLDQPALDQAHRRALELGLGFAPTGDQVPRGRIDVLRGRVEHIRIRRPVAAAGGALGDTEVRRIDVGLGAASMTLHVDRALLATITAQAGWSWLEADGATGRLADNRLHVRIGAHAMWRRSADGPRSLGIALVREPGYTADGQRLVSERRLELTGGAEDHRCVLRASGGVSWLRRLAGGAPQPMVARYGSHLEAFVKLARSIELGGYHAIAYEPPVAGDPWAAPRQWSTEAGALVRWRPSTFARLPRSARAVRRHVDEAPAPADMQPTPQDQLPRVDDDPPPPPR